MTARQVRCEATRGLRRRGVVVGLVLAVVLAACSREKREFESPLPPSTTPETVKATPLRPGAVEALEPGVVPSPDAASHYEENAYLVAQGKRLFRWYNCSGCHGGGGGNMGPPLMDDKWLYGSAPLDIFRTIVQGRPNGMPAFGGRIPEAQVWQIVAYVRSVSGQLRKDVAPSRGDTLSGPSFENERHPEKPVPFAPAPASAQKR